MSQKNEGGVTPPTNFETCGCPQSHEEHTIHELIWAIQRTLDSHPPFVSIYFCMNLNVPVIHLINPVG
jgi:hypothetical protein